MIRLQENVPEIYTKASRDFQAFCRIYDIVNNSTRFNIESTQVLLDPLLVSDRLLPLLATRVGFFPKYQYNTHVLRMVISVFPYMMKYKGSTKSIEIAVHTILKAEQHFGNVEVKIYKNSSNVTIFISTKVANELLLKDVLSYVLPIGYDVFIRYSTPINSDETKSQLSVDSSDIATANLKANVMSQVLGYEAIVDINSSADPALVKQSNGDQTISIIPKLSEF